LKKDVRSIELLMLASKNFEEENIQKYVSQAISNLSEGNILFLLNQHQKLKLKLKLKLFQDQTETETDEEDEVTVETSLKQADAGPKHKNLVANLISFFFFFFFFSLI